MAPFCREHGVHLLAYGTLCGGLLSERYLDQPSRAVGPGTASLQKYKRMVDAWALAVVRTAAALHEVRIGTPPTSRPWRFDGCSIGRPWRARSSAAAGLTDHRADNIKIFTRARCGIATAYF